MKVWETICESFCSHRSRVSTPLGLVRPAFEKKKMCGNKCPGRFKDPIRPCFIVSWLYVWYQIFYIKHFACAYFCIFVLFIYLFIYLFIHLLFWCRAFVVKQLSQSICFETELSLRLLLQREAIVFQNRTESEAFIKTRTNYFF